MPLKVTIRLKEASEPMVFEGVLNTYTKGPMFCLRLPDKSTLKWPLIGVFNVHEEGGFTSQKKPYTIDIEPAKAKDLPPTVPFVEGTHAYGTIRFELVGTSPHHPSSTWEATSGARVFIYKGSQDTRWSTEFKVEPEDRTALSDQVIDKMRAIVWPKP